MTVTVTDPHGASTVHSVHFDTLEVQPTDELWFELRPRAPSSNGALFLT